MKHRAVFSVTAELLVFISNQQERLSAQTQCTRRPTVFRGEWGCR